MKIHQLAAALTLGLVLIGPGLAQSNVEANKDAQKQLKQEHKAHKAQAKADKDKRKALDTKEQKKADKAQDKANREANKATTPQQ